MRVPSRRITEKSFAQSPGSGTPINVQCRGCGHKAMAGAMSTYGCNVELRPYPGQCPECGGRYVEVVYVPLHVYRRVQEAVL